MRTEIINPDSRDSWLRLRVADVTSTEVASLFDLSPWQTRLELHHNKANQTVVEIEETDRMFWGNVLQDAIANGIAKQQGWKIRPMTEYIRAPDLRLGASFDYEILDIDGILEIKNVDSLIFKEGWLVSEDKEKVEAPEHIEIQLQQQMMLAKKKVGYIGAFVGGNRVELIKREPSVAVHEAIVEAAYDFWLGVDTHEPPPPQFPEDADFICKLHSSSTAGKVMDASGSPEFINYMLAYKEVGEQMKELQGRKDEIKAKLLMAAGDAEKVVGPWGSLGLGIVKGGSVSYVREDYRSFRPYYKKVK